MAHPSQFDNVSAITLANVYFEGKVISHSLMFADGTKKTLGLIYLGEFEFNTEAAEGMTITAGTCRVQQRGEDGWITYNEGDTFHISANSSFRIAVDEGVCQYICSFIV